MIFISKIYFLIKTLPFLGLAFRLIFAPELSIPGDLTGEERLRNSQARHIYPLSSPPPDSTPGYRVSRSEAEMIMEAYGLIDIARLDTSIRVTLAYTGTDNFLKKDVYGDLTSAYLQPDVALKLVQAHTVLKKKYPGYRFLILDAARPRSIQYIMWDSISVPESEKEKFLAHPSIGSLHNYGAAVDLTIVDSSGKHLDMGTEYDSFQDLAYPMMEQRMLREGKLSQEAYNNRLILRSVMNESGFTGIHTEWWHFNSCTRRHAQENYSLIESHLLADNPSLAKYKTSGGQNEKDFGDKAINHICYKIQIYLSSRPVQTKSSVFKGLHVEYYKHDGYYKYTEGKYTDLVKARERQEELRSMGFQDAFVVAFYKNKRISVKDAIELCQ